MLKQIVIAGSAAAVVLGAGTAALAASGSSSPSPSASTTATPAKAKAHRSELARALHASWVTRHGSTFVTHDAIRGQVTAVSATSITVTATDKVSQTFKITTATRVHTKAAGKGKTASIAGVHTGDKVLVGGTGTGTLTATRVADTSR